MSSLSYIWLKASTPPDRRPIKVWARENINLPAVLTTRGKFGTDESRHFDAPLDALHSDLTRGVRLLKPVRGGGTLIADVFAPWAIVNRSASVLWIFQDDLMAKMHAERRQMPILKSVPTIKPMLPVNRHHNRTQDIIFNNGLPFSMQGPALGGLQSQGYMVVITDEVWMYDSGVLAHAKARMGDFIKNASNKFLAISQGGEENSDWHFEYQSGVEYVWHVRCAACNSLIAPEWTMLGRERKVCGAVFETIKFEDGTYNKDDTAKTVRFVCPHCDHEHADTAKTRSDWNRNGQYICTKTKLPFDPNNIPTEVSFRWHGLCDWPWGQLVKYWLSAQEAKHVGDFKPLVSFLQKYCTVFRSENTIHDGDLPFARVHIHQVAPIDKLPGEKARFLTADRQSEDVYWVTIRAWMDGGESCRLWFGRLYSEVDVEAKRAEYGVNPDCTVVDSGYRPKGDHGVYAACIKYGWIAAKGTDEPFFWHMEQQPDGTTARVQKPWAPLSWGDPGEGTSAEGRNRCPLIRFSAPSMAQRVWVLIKLGLWIEPDGDETNEIEREYRIQMSSEFERPKIDKFTGRKVMVNVCPSGNNHAFDDAKMQVLCAMHAGLLPAGIELEAKQNEISQ